MRAFRSVTTGVLILVLHCTAQAGAGPRWILDIPDPDVPHDPLCDKLQKVVDDYFRRYPKEPAACIATALGEAFDLPPWQPIPDPGRDFAARIEKYSQVRPQSFFADQEKGKPVEDLYFYRADQSKKAGRSFFVWRAKFDDHITSYQIVPGATKTILQYRSPNPSGGCATKPDRDYSENLVLMAPDLSAPLKLEDSAAYSLLIDASLRLHKGQPILINGPDVYQQLPAGFSPVCRFKQNS
jgi:hypothetical protein